MNYDTVNRMLKFIKKEGPFLYNDKTIEIINKENLITSYVKKTTVLNMSSLDIFKIYVLYQYVHGMKTKYVNTIDSLFISNLEDSIFESSIPSCHRGYIINMINHYKRNVLLKQPTKIDYVFLENLLKG